MSAHRYTLLDVFTDRPCAGNALAVVHDADGLSDAEMLAFARETDLSETSFVQAPAVEGAAYRNRIWTVTGELRFAGHPSLGVAVAVARAGGEDRARYVQQTGAGLQPVEVEIDGLRARASMHQEPATFGPEVDAAEALGAAGLGPDAAARGLPPQVVSTGIDHLMVPVADRAALDEAAPDDAALTALLERLGAVVLYLAHADGADVHARGFTPVVGGFEDPATGSAAGPLCAYLAERAGTPAITIAQGEAMGRPSLLRAEMDGDRVRVAGDAVVLVDGTLHL